MAALLAATSPGAMGVVRDAQGPDAEHVEPPSLSVRSGPDGM